MNSLVKSFRPVNAFPSFFDGFLNELDQAAAQHFTQQLPAVNVSQDEDGFKLELAAPGLKKEDFNIKVDGQTLSVSAEKKTEETEQKEKYTRKEFSYTNFSRSFRLPKSVDLDKIEASHENGILFLSLPKKEEAKPREPKLITVA
ncbi:Hsp20/alpha crystallin family protein [Marinilongibacter aquaticus]|uniref:Hsp20/alpha crystallin family protein n=1 Tax=Marinilongibacter aquaticus TaxID=2975157 RepID=UPI0021BDE0A6|nr:Hsp20/alpha crystallin family protein [Marinilongibacter aquaticus]UBM57601.1 Hsp20/alpha crystallin family protein [Marinilongibacter aquaticus]